MMTDLSPARLGGAAALVVAYVLMCGRIALSLARQKRAEHVQAQSLLPAPDGTPPVLVVYASQTGQAEELAWHTGRLLHAAGQPVKVLSMRHVTADVLTGTRRALFIVSTYGEGDPPDAAAPFALKVMSATTDLSQLQYAVLALGDATYAHYCGFGRTLYDWLSRCGATPQFERIEVDRADVAAISRWQHQLGHIASLDDLPDWQAPDFEAWTLERREQLNAGSAGQPVFHLELSPPAGVAARWESGDLAQVQVPADPAHAREYSIGSIASDGKVHLLVRRQLRDDGQSGFASGWLTGLPMPDGTRLGLGEPVRLRLRAHRNFRLEENADRPLVLIGNGTGLAGLRGHLRTRAAADRGDNWLLFGERQAEHDALYADEIAAWRKAGRLARVDLVYSRDQPTRRYVQHCLREAAEEVRCWADRGAAFYVCGSLEGMAQAVDDALAEILGRDRLDELAASGRYRRDVY